MFFQMKRGERVSKFFVPCSTALEISYISLTKGIFSYTISWETGKILNWMKVMEGGHEYARKDGSTEDYYER